MPFTNLLSRSSSSSPSTPTTLLILTTTFTLGVLTATGALLSIQSARRTHAAELVKRSIPSISHTHAALPLTDYGAAASSERAASDTALEAANVEDARNARLATRARNKDTPYDETLILEQLSRNRLFLTDEGLSKLRKAVVVVVGLGGVGSHAVAALVRSGVTRVRIVDFDQITLSSLNRHALATLADVGSSKVDCVRKRLEAICPWVRIDARAELFEKGSEEKLLAAWNGVGEGEHDDYIGQTVDFVIDAIDNIDTKVALLEYCSKQGLKVISAMGAACKSDPTRVCVGDISTSLEDPLSKAVRRRLKIAGVASGIPVVFSTEKPGEGKAKIQDINESEAEKGDVGDLSVLPDFRVRILPVLGTMPAVFGYSCATYVICAITGYPMEYRVGEKGRDKMYESMLSALQGSEEKLARLRNSQDAVGLRLPISKDDIAYLVEEVYRGKSVVSGLSTRLVLIRWTRPRDGNPVSEDYLAEGQKASNLKLNDVVLMTKEEAKRHEEQVLKGGKSVEETYSSEVLTTVAKRRAEERLYERYR